MEVVARLGKKVDVVVCSGGDGTLNETISGMMKLKKMPLLGYIPAGSTNDFATSLGIPKRMPLAAWDIVEGTPFAIDTGTFCEDMNFMYIAAFAGSGTLSFSSRIPPSRVNTTSPHWVASITARWRGFSFTRSVALKNRIVAITPENRATHSDWNTCPRPAGPAFTQAQPDMKIQKGMLHSVMP